MISTEVLARVVDEAAEPELARKAIARIGERPTGRALLARPDIAPAAARLLGFSTSAADFFSAHPEELEALADLRRRTLEELVGECTSSVAAVGPSAGLRRFRRRAGYRVAARDLAGAPVDEVMEDLTAVAEACLRVAVLSVDGPGRLAVIALGKLGGEELNYSSDVDLIFAHRSTDGTNKAGAAPAGGGSDQEAASDLVGRLIALVSEPTEEGVALRVDADLRPQGRAGPLSRSLHAMLEYYERHAATWELQALLKARPVAGPPAGTARFVEAITALAYPAVLPTSAIDEVRASKSRIEEHVRALGKEGREVKRGRGGIRDVEFAVQLLQLVHGRRDPRLRQPNTLRALAALAEEGYVAQLDAESLADSYRFLRRLEHRLQMVRDLQTHELPTDRRMLVSLARSMGLGDADRLLAEYARHTESVRGVHERLFYRPLLEAYAGPAAPRPGVDQEATRELLAGMGFADPVAAYRGFAAIVEPPDRLSKVLGTLFPVVAPALAFSADPDPALVRFVRVAEALRGDPPSASRTAEMLVGRPDAARRLAALVATSTAFADMLVAEPGLIAGLNEVPVGQRPMFPGESRVELVRTAGAYSAGELKVPEVGRRLAEIGDGVVAEALAAAAPELPVAVISLGTLGGEELSFGSDLDVVFAYDGEGSNDFEAACRTAERTLAHLTAAGWQADPDLRPEGRSGPLARSMVSYLDYWERWAETWEYQALLRARFVAGDESLGRRFLSNAADFAYPEHLSFERVAAIRRMRVRMEEERVRPPDARRFHFKLGYGALADVQFAVELDLMRHGFERPDIRRTHTLEALEALSATRLMEDSVARSLGEAYVFLTEVKSALEIERRLPVEALPPTPEGQSALARRLGYGERARHQFLEDYRRITRQARRAMERVFFGQDG